MTTSLTPPAAEVPIRKAASVLLLRETPYGFEVFVQHRANTMDFAAGMVVYPGGRVDTQDAQEAEKGMLDSSLLAEHAQQWKHSSVFSEGEQRAVFYAGEILAAARREVFEETGLLLDPEQLHPWANWVTPPGLPRRFDTFFFIAELRPEQQPRHQTTEAVTSKWIHPEALFAALERGELKMMRPTQRTLLDALEHGSIDQILASKPVISSIRPDVKSAQTGSAVKDSERHFNG